jgi:hypothetical protein
MALFPIVDNRVQLNTDAVEAIDAFRNGVRLLADDSACRASLFPHWVPFASALMLL